MLETLNGLWFGDRLGYLEQLSIKTALALGHPYVVYSYDPSSLAGVPDGAELRHAHEIKDDPRRTKYLAGKFKALASDFFRYELLAQGKGMWVDLDLIFLRPLQFDSDFVFGWERENSLNGAVLKLPADSAMLAELRAIPEKNWCPPHAGPRQRVRYYWRRLQGDVELDDLPWGAAGPGMITWLAQRTGAAALAQPIPVFYPLPYDKGPLLFGPPAAVDTLITPETRAIHMWHSSLRGLSDRPPPPGSYIDTLCRKFGVATDGAV